MDCPSCSRNNWNQDSDKYQCRSCGWRESDAAQREREPGEDETVVVSRQVVWDCICGEQNFTDLPAEYVVCAECGEKFSQFDIAGDDGTYEQTMYDEGETYFDAFVPDFPDTDDESDYPEETGTS